MLVNKSHSAKVGFGYKLAVDSGASDTRKGSLKITMFSNEGDKLISSNDNELKNFPKNVCPNGIKSAEDYVNGLKARINSFIKNSVIKDIIKGLKGDDKKLKGIALFVPGATLDNKAEILPNLKDENDQPLKKVNFNKIDMGKKGVDENYKLLALNDMAGAAAYVAKALANKEELNNGLKATVCMTGGGCGVASIKVLNGQTVVETSEMGHIKGLKTNKPLEKEGASVPALITNYADTLSLSADKKNKLLDLGNAKIVTQYPVKLEKDCDEAKKIRETELFDEKVSNNNSSFTLKELKKEQHEEASGAAINAYLDSVAQIAHIEAAKGTNKFILTGPLAQGIKQAVNGSGSGNNFDKTIKSRAMNLLGNSAQAMADLYKFSIDSSIEIPDNTLGGPSLLDGKFVSESRGNWVGIPTESLKNTNINKS